MRKPLSNMVYFYPQLFTPFWRCLRYEVAELTPYFPRFVRTQAHTPLVFSSNCFTKGCTLPFIPPLMHSMNNGLHPTACCGQYTPRSIRMSCAVRRFMGLFVLGTYFWQFVYYRYYRIHRPRTNFDHRVWEITLISHQRSLTFGGIMVVGRFRHSAISEWCGALFKRGFTCISGSAPAFLRFPHWWILLQYFMSLVSSLLSARCAFFLWGPFPRILLCGLKSPFVWIALPQSPNFNYS